VSDALSNSFAANPAHTASRSSLLTSAALRALKPLRLTVQRDPSPRWAVATFPSGSNTAAATRTVRCDNAEFNLGLRA
jgi:hypothetical protein